MSSMLIIYMLWAPQMHATVVTPAAAATASQYRDRGRIRFRPFRKMDFQQAVFQFRLGIFVINRDLDGNFSSEVPIRAFDAVVRCDSTAGRFLTFKAGDDQHAL